MSDDLRAKYGAEAFEAGRTLQPRTFERRVAQRDGIDQHFTRLPDVVDPPAFRLDAFHDHTDRNLQERSHYDTASR